MRTTRTPYPSDVTDDEWEFAAPYLTLMTEDAPQRAYGLREVLNALRWLVKTGGQWRMMPHDFPPWAAVWAGFIATAPRENFRDQGGMFITFGVAFFAVVGGALVAGWLPWAVLWVCRVGRDLPPAGRGGSGPG